jgi:hypothetical protein
VLVFRLEQPDATARIIGRKAMSRLNHRVAIVTGGSLGIGRACAIRTAEAGAAIAVFDVMDEEGRKLAEEPTQRGFCAAYWHVDVARKREVQAAIDQVAAQFGKLDIVVNNAGISGANKPTDEITEAEWDLVQAVNVKGVFFCVKHAVPHLRRAGGGSIVNLSSIYGILGAPDVPPYHASKGGPLHEQDRRAAVCARPDQGEFGPSRLHLDADGGSLPAVPARSAGGAQRREYAAPARPDRGTGRRCDGGCLPRVRRGKIRHRR